MSTEVHRLVYDNTITDIGKHVQHVFGHLVKMAAPVLKAYHSDLYHDAIWLSAHVQGEAFTFYYSYNESGTSIGTDPKLVCSREYSYRMTVRNDDGKTTLEIEEQ